MKSFTKVYVSTKIKSKENNKVVVIYKFQKDGTKRFFFAPEFEGKKINTVMYARLSCAVNLAKQFLKQQN